MRFQFAALRPVIGAVVVSDVTEQKARIALVNNQSNVAVHPNRPEILVPRLVELVEAHSGTSRVELQVEGSRFDSLLLIPCQSSEAVGKRVGNAKISQASYSLTFWSTV